jgi:ribosomal protein S27AE
MAGISQGKEVHRSMGYQGHRSVSKPDGSTKDGWYSYICGHCNTKVSGAVVCGYYEDEEPPIKWLLCPNCGNGSVLAKDGNVYPRGKKLYVRECFYFM